MFMMLKCGHCDDAEGEGVYDDEAMMVVMLQVIQRKEKYVEKEESQDAEQCSLVRYDTCRQKHSTGFRYLQVSRMT
jgi:hypothetical protein